MFDSDMNQKQRHSVCFLFFPCVFSIFVALIVSSSNSLVDSSSLVRLDGKVVPMPTLPMSGRRLACTKFGVFGWLRSTIHSTTLALKFQAYANKTLV